MDCRPSGFSVFGIFQARILERVTIYFTRRSFQPRDQTRISCIGRWILYCWATGEAHKSQCRYCKKEKQGCLSWVLDLLSGFPIESSIEIVLRESVDRWYSDHTPQRFWFCPKSAGIYMFFKPFVRVWLRNSALEAARGPNAMLCYAKLSCFSHVRLCVTP